MLYLQSQLLSCFCLTAAICICLWIYYSVFPSPVSGYASQNRCRNRVIDWDRETLDLRMSNCPTEWKRVNTICISPWNDPPEVCNMTSACSADTMGLTRLQPWLFWAEFRWMRTLNCYLDMEHLCLKLGLQSRRVKGSFVFIGHIYFFLLNYVIHVFNVREHFPSQTSWWICCLSFIFNGSIHLYIACCFPDNSYYSWS